MNRKRPKGHMLGKQRGDALHEPEETAGQQDVQTMKPLREQCGQEGD